MGKVNFIPELQAVIFVLIGRFHEARIVSYSDLVHRFEHFRPPPVLLVLIIARYGRINTGLVKTAGSSFERMKQPMGSGLALTLFL